jgi:hypothetical protein
LSANTTGFRVVLGTPTPALATAPAITIQPANQTVTAGQSATFSVTATGTAVLSYQWKRGGMVVAGATRASYAIPVTAIGDSGAIFTVVVSNGAGSVVSRAANLTVGLAPAITAQPADQSVAAGQTATFSVAATGTGILTYQ